MRRALAIVLGTMTGGALLVGAKLGNASTPPSTDASDAAGAVTVSGDASASPAAPHSTSPASKASGAKPSASAKANTDSPSPTKTTSKPTPPANSGLKNGTYSATATVAHNRGTLSMTVTISSGKVTDIKASEANPSEPNCWRSACPTLRGEALSAQSANIHAVSGATYTSDAYRSSLQAILDKATSPT